MHFDVCAWDHRVHMTQVEAPSTIVHYAASYNPAVQPEPLLDLDSSQPFVDTVNKRLGTERF